MEMILKFTDNGKEYALFQEGKELKPCLIEGGVYKFNISEEDKSYCLEILEDVKPSNEIIEIAKINRNEKEFVHLVDKKNLFNIFYEVKNGEYVVPCKEDIVFFNNTFNYQSEYMYLGKEEKKDGNFFKRIIKKGKKVLAVLVTSAVLFATPALAHAEDIDPNIPVLNTSTYSITQDVNSSVIEESKTITYEEIVSLINNNPNLSQEEKDLILTGKEFFKENCQYFDYDFVKNTLETVKIEYISEDKRPGVKGDFHKEYDENGNEEAIIRIYNASSFEDSEKVVITHEICHGFQKFDHSINALCEFINMTINNEYYGRVNKPSSTAIYDTGYTHLNGYGCALLEIIDNPEFVKKFHAQGSEEMLINELMKIIPDENLAYSTLIAYNHINLNDRLDSSSPYIRAIGERDKSAATIRENLRKYYLAKTNENIETNPVMQFFLDKETFQNEIKEYYDLPGEIADINIYSLKKYINTDNLEENNMIIKVFTKYNDGYDYLTKEELINRYPKYINSNIDFLMTSDGKYQVPHIKYVGSEISFNSQELLNSLQTNSSIIYGR